MKKIPWDKPDIGQDELWAVSQSINSGHLGGNGPNVEKFEIAFANKIGVKFALAVNNGTSALLVSLFAMKEYLGTELKVAVPSLSFIASANTAEIVGKALLTDCDKYNWNMRLEDIPAEANVIMPVDVGGLPVNYDYLKYADLPMIADSAESVGAVYKDEYVGSQADMHCFSFQRSKIITCGEGGMITTNNYDLYYMVKSWVNHGYDDNKKPWQYHHIGLGLNCRMTDLEASIGLVQLEKLDYYVQKRIKIAEVYKEILGNLVEYQKEPIYAVHPYFFFGILIDSDNDELCRKAWKLGIQLKTWNPAHTQPHFNDNFLPNADDIGKRIVLLPIHNCMTEEEVIYVGETVKGLL